VSKVRSVLNELHEERKRFFKVVVNLLKLAKIKVREISEVDTCCSIDKGDRFNAVKVLNKIGYSADKVTDEYFDKNGYGGISIENEVTHWVLTIIEAPSQMSSEEVMSELVEESVNNSKLPQDKKLKLIALYIVCSDSRLNDAGFEMLLDFVKANWTEISQTCYCYKGVYVSFFKKEGAVTFSNQPDLQAPNFSDNY
jgi:hypothetical protein